MKSLWIIFVLAITSLEHFCTATDSFKYLLYAPNTLHAGRTENIHFEFSVTDQVAVSVELIEAYKDNATALASASGIIEDGRGYISIEVPQEMENWWYGSLNFVAQLESTKDSIDGSASIRIRRIRPVTFVEMDKPIYKPGQTVRFRILTIDETFRPVLTPVGKVRIESPSQTELAKWTDLETEDGLIDLEFELADEPALGKYVIYVYPPGLENVNSWELNYIEKNFQVDEYVLPKYEITATAKGFILINAERYQFSICGKYTYGQPVRGRINGNLKVYRRNYYYSTPIMFLNGSLYISEEEKKQRFRFAAEADQDGCATFDLDVTSLKLNSSSNPYSSSYMSIESTFTEAGTENSFKETHRLTKLVSYPMTLSFQATDSYKPGLRYYAQLKAVYPDDTPATNELITVTAKYKERIIFEQNLTIDSSGVASFEVDTSLIEPSENIVLEAFSPGYTRPNYTRGFYSVYDATAYKYVKPAYSPSGRFVQIEKLNQKLSASTSQEFVVYYTSDDASVSDDFVFKFVARGNIIDAVVTPVTQSRKRRFSEPLESLEALELILLTKCQTKVSANEFAPGAFIPTCTEDGSFTPKQCHGSTGYCWCVDLEGEEINGTSKGPTEADEVVCAEIRSVDETECQRQVRLAQAGELLIGAFTPNCTEDGSYTPKQCHPSTGYCWCVDEQGEQIVGTVKGPTEVEEVVCIEIIPPETECQRRVREGSLLLGAYIPQCSEDGSFLLRQCHGSSGHCWCVDDQGVEINGTRRGPTEVEEVVCLEIVTIPPIVILTPTPVVHPTPQALQQARFSFKVIPEFSPKAHLMVYYISEDDEVVADSLHFDVNNAFENEVSLDFSEVQELPGGTTKLKINARSGSLCAVGIVDKSVNILGGEHQFTGDKIFYHFSQFDLYKTNQGRRCGYGFYRYKRSPLLKRLQKRSDYYISRRSSGEYTDSEEAFLDSGLLVESNFDLQVAPCPEGGFRRYGIPLVLDEASDTDYDLKGEVGSEGEAKLRSYFPETWLWTLKRVGEGALSTEVDLMVPHTITDWVASGFCTSVRYGVGIAEKTQLRAFQPFFLSLHLPYSIIRAEKVPIKISVFNYLEQCAVVRVTVAESEDFELLDKAEQIVSVAAGESTVITYRLTSSNLGDVPVRVSAVSVTDSDNLCGNEGEPVELGASDAVERTVLIKPEGEPTSISDSGYFCLEDGDLSYRAEVTLELPNTYVPDTATGEVTVTGDLIGNTLLNTENLIRMPYGCGEQNIVSMVPNIVALKYLTATDRLTAGVEKEAKSYIRKGYQRELNYRRSDDSYAAFGDRSSAGSTFLTAFVIRSYAQASEFITIDENDLNVTIEWLRGIQEKDGHFRTVGYLAHKAMQGGVNNNLTLAAYVMATFLEAGLTTADSTVARTVEFINSHLDTLVDAYATCLVAYAYALADLDEFDTVYTALQDMAVEEEGMKYWQNNRDNKPSYTSYYQASSKAQNVEMSAYVLRALLAKNHPDKIIEGSKIARWLVKQRNPRGGFQSTQDTVVGMTALAEFSELSTANTFDLTVTVNAGEKSEDFAVTDDNRYQVQKMALDSFPVTVSFAGSGIGCALWQASVDYYEKKELKEMNPFTLKTSTSKKDDPKRKKRQADETEEEETCASYRISIQASYNGEDGGSNMALIRVRPATGMIFNKESLEELASSFKELKRYETDGDTVTFYFEEITSDEIKFDFDVDVDLEVEDAKPGLVTIVDYYENDLSVSQPLEFRCVALPGEDPLDKPGLVPTTPYTTPFSPRSWPRSSTSVAPIEDIDECASVVDVCGGPEYVCVNFPGTYECQCADGYQFEETTDTCVEIPPCPHCGETLPEGFEEKYCAAEFAYSMKVRLDGSARLLIDLRSDTSYAVERKYYDLVLDERCSCNLIDSGGRFIIIGSSSHVEPSSGRWDEAINISRENIILPSLAEIKKDVAKATESC